MLEPAVNEGVVKLKVTPSQFGGGLVMIRLGDGLTIAVTGLIMLPPAPMTALM